ncbi:hypothetical protein GGF37_006939, partial [Kickxella alabastrina]
MHSDAASPSHMSPWGASAAAPFAQHHDHHDPRDYHDYHDPRDHDYHDPHDHRLQPQMLPQMHPQVRAAPPSAWGSTHMRQALDPARAALSQSPQPARYQGHGHYQPPLHDSLRKPLPSYSHPASSSISSPNPVSMVASAPQALQPHAHAQALPPPPPSQLHHGQPPTDYFEAPYPQMLPPAHTFPAYRPLHMAEDGRPPLQQQQQHFGQHRPWSPHHRAQVQSHHSPAHAATSFVSESRYSPYTRQPDAVRDPRHRMSPSVRISSTVVPPAQDAAQQQHYYQPPTRHQQRPLHFSVVTSSSAPETPSASTLAPAAAVAHAHTSRLARRLSPPYRAQPPQQQQNQRQRQQHDQHQHPQQQHHPQQNQHHQQHQHQQQSATGTPPPSSPEPLSAPLLVHRGEPCARMPRHALPSSA